MTAKIDMSARFLNRPILVSEEFAHTIVASKDLLIDDMRDDAAQMWLDVSLGTRKPYRMEGSVAVVPINGRLYNKVNWAGFSYTGYQYITAMLDFAEQDPDVKGVMLDIDSGGGEVDGAFETAERIKAFKKPIQASATHAYSAAYLLASAADRLTVTKTGGVGSIGVVTMHADLSKAYEQMGASITLLYKGKHKVDGNPYEPLPKDVKARIETRLEESYSLFVDTVAVNRSMEAQAVRDTEALTYGSREALSLGLVDSVSSPEEAMAAFEAELSNGKQRGTSMTVATDSKQTTKAEQPGSEASNVVNQQALDSAKAEGVKAGAEAERARILGILDSEEAKGRETTARMLCKQGLSVEQAKEILASVPSVPAKQAAAANNFAAAMEGTPNPEVPAEQAQASAAEESAWKKALSALSIASGEKFNVN